MPWISCRHWRRFQHYDPAKRQPPWIKNYTELMSDDSYLGLSGHERGVLHGIWLEYAASRCRLPLDARSSRSRSALGTLTLSRRLALNVSSTTLERLVDAGWIEIVASAALAEGYHDASARAHDVEEETEEEKIKDPEAVPSRTNPDDDIEPHVGNRNGLRSAQQLHEQTAASLRSIP